MKDARKTVKSTPNSSKKLAPLFSSASVEWSTPKRLFDALNREFHFTLDPCATAENAKCHRFFDEKMDGLAQNWGGETVYCNPPYGRKSTREWLEKCHAEARKGVKIVVLIPARTDTLAFQKHALGAPEATIIFVEGRLKFGDGDSPAPFPSALIFYNCRPKNPHFRARYFDAQKIS